MTTSKATFHLPASLWDAFSKQTDELFLKRGPFLDHVLARELDHVAADLEGLKLSVRANRWISGQFHSQKLQNGERSYMNVKPVSIELRKTTVEKLNEIVKRHHLVRDALLCRLIILLRAKDALLRSLEVPRDTTRSAAPFSISPMAALEEIRDDPFFDLREAVQRSRSVGLYLVPFPEALAWATCFIEDELVPTTGAYKKRQADLEALFDEDSLLFPRTGKLDEPISRDE